MASYYPREALLIPMRKRGRGLLHRIPGRRAPTLAPNPPPHPPSHLSHLGGPRVWLDLYRDDILVAVPVNEFIAVPVLRAMLVCMVFRSVNPTVLVRRCGEELADRLSQPGEAPLQVAKLAPLEARLLLCCRQIASPTDHPVIKLPEFLFQLAGHAPQFGFLARGLLLEGLVGGLHHAVCQFGAAFFKCG